MQNYSLQRTGGAAVVFSGQIRAEAHSAPERERKHGYTREHSLRVYQARNGQTWVVEIEYTTTWPQEHNSRTVYVLRIMDETGVAQAIADRLREYDPTTGIMGFPPNPDYQDRQQRLMAWHRAEWAATVTRCLSLLPGETVGEMTAESRAIALERLLERSLDHAMVLLLVSSSYHTVERHVCAALRDAREARQDNELHRGAPVSVEPDDRLIRALDADLPPKCSCGEPCDQGEILCPVCLECAARLDGEVRP